MVLAKGSIVKIASYEGALAEDYTVGLSSEFKSLADDFQNEVTELINVLGATAKSLSAGRIGFSSRFKQLYTQIWESTAPANISIGVTFDRKSNSEKDIMPIVREFCKFPLPGEGVGGNLIPPGPSPIEGIGLDALWGGTAGATDTYINFTIGKINFNRFIMIKAEPTFNKYSDDSGFPISVTIAFDFISMWAATKDMVHGWFR
jgi:hypothetical protein